MVKHELANTEYNQRREDCEAAARITGPLRDLTMETFEQRTSDLAEQSVNAAGTWSVRMPGCCMQQQAWKRATSERLADT